jgi:hypothetical protein
VIATGARSLLLGVRHKKVTPKTVRASPLKGENAIELNVMEQNKTSLGNVLVIESVPDTDQ